jgi:hypothetical protein
MVMAMRNIADPDLIVAITKRCKWIMISPLLQKPMIHAMRPH